MSRKVYGFSDDFIGDSVTDIEKRHAMLAIQTGQSVVIEDTSKEEWADVIHFKKHGIRSVIVIPINGKDRPIGVISFLVIAPQRNLFWLRPIFAQTLQHQFHFLFKKY